MKKGTAPMFSIALLLIAGIAIAGFASNWTFQFAAVPGVQPPTQCADPGTSRTVTVTATDELYNPGTAITMFPFAYKKSTEGPWTFTDAVSFSATAGIDYDIALGLNETTATTADPQPLEGPVIKYRVPCDAASTLYVGASNDALGTDLTAVAIDPNDGTVISAAATMDIDAGGPQSIAVDWYSSFEENFGTVACGEMSNVYVVHLNSTAYDEENTELHYNGQKLASTTVPQVLTAVSGYKDLAFKGPILKSTAGQGQYLFTLVVDPDDTLNPSGTWGGNVTVYAYDSHIYYDNDDASVNCGVEDQDTGTEIGAAAADSLVIYVYDDLGS